MTRIRKMDLTTMTNERFEALLDAYGADPRHWPDAERDAALVFAKSSAAAQRRLEEAAVLDRLIDQADTAPVTPELQEKILATFAQAHRGGSLSATFARLLPGRAAWVPATALAASLALGLGVGTFLPALAGIGEVPSADAALMAFGDVDAGMPWDDAEEGS
ncbi:MAG: hypothetical protein K8S25_13340 [Alphaproteobacteria bacterium]|nr:hypothetical protein [Alphaproteobacteria bacterium]